MPQARATLSGARSGIEVADLFSILKRLNPFVAVFVVSEDVIHD
jgi:hypothetical protein